MRIFILTIFLIIGISACQKTSYEILVLNGLTMGTTYSVKINTDNAFVEKNKISNDIDEILSEINQSMSTYIKESELSNINYSTISDWQSISDDLFEVINHAINVSLKTNGAFDITIAPLVNLWGFGPDKLQNKIPTDEIIELTKKNTGYKKISIDKSLKMISKLEPNLHIDLSGIAKGFAVDKIARYLDKCGFKNYLVEIGGELIGKGLNKDKEIIVVVEHVNAMPGQGVTSMFNFGQSFGVIKGICSALSLPIYFVRPTKWKKYFNLIKTNKDASRTKVIEVYPEISSKLSRKKDSNKADAILIARYFNDTQL